MKNPVEHAYVMGGGNYSDALSAIAQCSNHEPFWAHRLEIYLHVGNNLRLARCSHDDATTASWMVYRLWRHSQKSLNTSFEFGLGGLQRRGVLGDHERPDGTSVLNSLLQWKQSIAEPQIVAIFRSCSARESEE